MATVGAKEFGASSERRPCLLSGSGDSESASKSFARCHEHHRNSIMRKARPAKWRADERRCIGIALAGWCGETHPASPALWRLGMNPSEDYPLILTGSLHDGGSIVGIFGDNVAPARELRAIFPILINCV